MMVHSTGRFLPWHRTFIHAAEIAMKQHCDYHGTSPYWDWTKDVADFYNSPIFSDPDPEAGLGGWGDSNTDARVLDGGFSHTSGFVLSYPFPHTLKRNFTLRPFLDFPDAEDWHVVPDMLGNMSLTPESIKKTVDSWIGDYRGFQADVEGKQMVDKVWRDWQLKHPENLNAFGGGSTQAKSGAENDIFPVGYPPDMKTTDYLESNGLFVVNLTIGDVLSTTGRYLCYVYE
ncbi:hypothetical protein DXG01_016883 [Tephrocybe rancida]|nr:hypothetical protein DXG01_016883 [Tephrocybe rancida]